MFVRIFRLSIILSFISVLSACVTVLDSVNPDPIQPDPGKRSLGAYIDDERLETIIAVNLRKAAPGLEEADLNIRSFNSVVLLTGEVPSKELKQMAGETARTTTGVRLVHNEVLVKAKSTFLSRMNDKMISTKMKAKLIGKKDFEAERVKVIVNNRIIYLMGLVTQEEALEISQTAASLSGVEKVVRVFEYITPENNGQL